jgi:nucleotide-binding universal stress UspA family protein
MKRYQRILVCIDKPERDYRMLGYTGAICRAAGTREVHLLHVDQVPPGPPAGVEVGAHPGPAKVTPEQLRDLAGEHLNGHGQEEVTALVLTGSPLVEILRYALDKDIDLIVIGRRAGGGKETTHEATLARRITQKGTCSVLVLPEAAPIKAEKVLAPVRDSECSANALEVACRVAAIKGGTVCCLNVFHVGGGYASVGSTLEEHTALMEKWAQRECEQLLRRVDTGGVNVVTRCVPDLYAAPVPIILDEMEKESTDLVVIGARGRTGAAGVLLGAVTERLIRQSAVPVLAVKKKGECIGVLRALLTLAG